MNAGETSTGAQASELNGRATEVEEFFVAEGGLWSHAMVDGRFALISSDIFAAEVNREPGGQTVRLFESPAERANYLNKQGVASVIYERGYATDNSGFPDPAVQPNAAGAALLAAAGDWLHEMSMSSTPLEKLQERDLENGLAEKLRETHGARKQVNLKQTADKAAAIRGWPGVGGLDLELQVSDGTAWAELKWAKSADYLYNCLWDAAKLATAVREGAADTGYLVAGAPASAWMRQIDYAKVFDFSGFENGSITNYNKRFASCWDGWRRENANTYPIEIADPVCTWPEGQVSSPNPNGSEPWIIRVARVTSPGSETVLTPYEQPALATGRINLDPPA